MSDFETGMRYVRATLGFEGLVLTEEEEKLLERRFHGEITEEEYIQNITSKKAQTLFVCILPL